MGSVWKHPGVSVRRGGTAGLVLTPAGPAASAGWGLPRASSHSQLLGNEGKETNRQQTFFKARGCPSKRSLLLSFVSSGDTKKIRARKGWLGGITAARWEVQRGQGGVSKLFCAGEKENIAWAGRGKAQLLCSPHNEGPQLSPCGSSAWPVVPQRGIGQDPGPAGTGLAAGRGIPHLPLPSSPCSPAAGSHLCHAAEPWGSSTGVLESCTQASFLGEVPFEAT